MRFSTLCSKSRFLCVNYQKSVNFSNENVEDSSEAGKIKLSGFAQSFIKQQQKEEAEEPEHGQQTFAALIRNSKFIDVSAYQNLD